jgi:hypothetical protein
MAAAKKELMHYTPEHYPSAQPAMANPDSEYPMCFTVHMHAMLTAISFASAILAKPAPQSSLQAELVGSYLWSGRFCCQKKLPYSRTAIT